MGEALSFPEGSDGHANDIAPSLAGAASVPNEGVLLSQLIQLLSQRQSLLLSDLGALLPKPLRQRVKDQGGLRSWLQRYQSLFLVSGHAGEESVTLVLCNSSGSGAEPGSTVAVEENASPPNGPLPVHDQASQVANTLGDEVDGQSAVQLRGLPYRATTEDVRTFLGEFAAKLADEHAIHLVLNRDGRPSGFARVQFATPEAAKQCQAELHLRSMDDRYVEVFLYTERPTRGRQWRGAHEDGALATGEGGGRSNLPDAPAVSREQVVKECRAEMAEQKNRRLLLSMLGVALSPGARSYLKQMDQGLKHFLAQFPGEFSVEGGKGCEYVTYTPTLHLSEALDYPSSTSTAPRPSMAGHAGSLSDELLPCSPKPTTEPAPSVKSTPSNWGTPLPSAPYRQSGTSSWLPPPWPPVPSTAPGTDGADGTANVWGAPPAWPMPPAQFWAGWPPAMYPWDTYPAASSEPADQGSAQTMPQAQSAAASSSPGLSAAVRLRGLPFTATEQDVLAFFSQHNIVDRITDGPKAVNLLLRSNGRPSGQAVVHMRDRANAELAQRVLHGQWMGSRYVEVFLYEEDNSELTAAPQATAAQPAAPVAGAAVPPPAPGAALPPWPWVAPPAGGATGPPLPGPTETSWEALFAFLGPDGAAAMGSTGADPAPASAGAMQ